MALFQNNEDFDVLSALRIRDADAAGFLHLGMLVKDLINIPRVDIEAAGYDHVFLAVHDIEVTVFIHFPDVPGITPSVPDHVGRFLRLVQVALHDLGTLDDDLSRLAHRKICKACLKIHDANQGIGDGNTDAPHLAGSAGKGIHVGDRRRFRQPKALNNHSARGSFKIPDHLDRERCAS